MSVASYLANLELSHENLALPSSEYLKLNQSVTRNDAADGVPFDVRAPSKVAVKQAAVDAGSVLSFVDGLSQTERDDVLYSVQLAQRAASKAFDRFSHTRDWYKKYVEVLERVGWVAEQGAFVEYKQAKGELSMDKAALEIIAAVASQNQLAVLAKSLTALQTLGEKGRPMELLRFHAATSGKGNFQLGSVQRSENGTLCVALGAFYFHAHDSRNRFLFATWGANDVEFWTCAQKLTLNSTRYAENREAVRAKLGNAQDYLSNLDLDRSRLISIELD